LLSVGDGKTMRINSGQELRLAQAGLFDDKEEKKEEPKDKPADKAKGMSTTAKVLIGLVTIGGGAALFSGGGGGSSGGGAASPAGN